MIRTGSLVLALSFGLTFGLCLAPGEANAQEAPAQISATAETTAAPASGDPVEDEIATLAEREAGAQEQLEFAGGGDGVYISSGAVVLVLVILIIIIIL